MIKSCELLVADAHVPIQNDSESGGLANETYSIKVQELAESGMNFVFVPKMEQNFGIEGKWSRLLKTAPERLYPSLNKESPVLSPKNSAPPFAGSLTGDDSVYSDWRV